MFHRLVPPSLARLSCHAIGILFAAVALTGCAKDPYLGMPPEKRVLVAARDVLGGTAAHDASRILKFDFVEKMGGRETERRNHDWDRKTGDYTIQWRDTESGSLYKVVFNTNKRDGYQTGTVIADSNRNIRDDELRIPICRKAYAHFIHDMHWLFAPYRADSRATATYVGREVDPRGALGERVDLRWVEGVAPNPTNKVWVDLLTHRWETSAVPVEGAADLYYTWDSWRQVGPGVFSLEHRQLNGEHSIVIEKLRVDPGMD